MRRCREKMICRILLLLILTSCVSVNVTQTSYQAEENHNITLEWTFTTKPDRSIKSLSITCNFINCGNEPEMLSNDLVHETSHIYRVDEGEEIPDYQDERFKGRCRSHKDALREGRIRLHLLRLRTDDSGRYLCHVKTDYGFGHDQCNLTVTVAEPPQPVTPTPSPQPESSGKIFWGIFLPVLGVFTILGVCVCFFCLRRRYANI